MLFFVASWRTYAPVKVVHSNRYHIDLGRHVFPTRKYRLVHDRLIAGRLVRPSDLVEPVPAAWDELALVPTDEYLARLRTGDMPHEELAQLERMAVIDCDVHHGNGTAFIFNPGGAPPPPPTRSDRRPGAYPGQHASEAGVFTFSIHQQHNYPPWKPRGSLDIGLPDDTGDAIYLDALELALPRVMAHEPECVFYLAGADPYEDDQLGGLRLTREGLRARDQMVIEAVCAAGVPPVIVLAGGYARHVEDTVAIHVATIWIPT